MKNFGKPDAFADHAFINFTDYDLANDIVEQSKLSPLILNGQ